MEENNNARKNSLKSKLHPEWLLPMLMRPKKTLQMILSDEKPKWLTPLLGLSLLGMIEVVVSGPIKKLAIQMGANLPPDFEYYSAEQQQQFMNAQASQTSPLFLYIFPILTTMAVIWISWFLLKSLLHLSLTLAGSRGKSVLSSNLVGWASVPLMLRSIVRILALLISQSLISARGLSGLVNAANGAGMFFAALLALVDIYFIWQVVLILLGTEQISGLPRSKAWGAAIVSVLILMLLMALPGFLSARMSGLSLSRMFYF